MNSEKLNLLLSKLENSISTSDHNQDFVGINNFYAMQIWGGNVSTNAACSKNTGCDSNTACRNNSGCSSNDICTGDSGCFANQSCASIA